MPGSASCAKSVAPVATALASFKATGFAVAGDAMNLAADAIKAVSYDESTAFLPVNIVSTGVNNKHQHYIKSQHNQEHQGAVYVVAGSASKVDKGPLDHPAHHMGLLEAGSMVIDIKNHKLIARFINNKGQVKDEFSITKDDQYVSGYRGCN